MKAEALLLKTQPTNNEHIMSGFSILVPESVINFAKENFTPDINKFLGLLVQLGVFIENGEVYQVLNDREERLRVTDFNPYIFVSNSKVIDKQFDLDSYKNLKSVLKHNSDYYMRDWLSRLFVFSLIAPNMNLKIMQKGVFKKLDISTFFNKSNHEIIQFNAEEN
jgi:hypothetical protein